MKCFLVAVFLAATFSFAQTTAVPTPAQAGANAPNPPMKGNILYVVLKNNVETKKAKVGDPVLLELLSDVVAGGKVVVPRKARLTASVVAVQPAAKDVPAQLSIHIQKVEIEEKSLNLEAVIAAPPRVPIPPQPGQDSVVAFGGTPNQQAAYANSVNSAATGNKGDLTAKNRDMEAQQASVTQTGRWGEAGGSIFEVAAANKTVAVDKSPMQWMPGVQLQQSPDPQVGTMVVSKGNIKLERDTRLVMFTDYQFPATK